MKCTTCSHKSRSPMMQRYSLIITSSCCVFLIGTPLDTARAQSPAGPEISPATSASAPDALISREEELRRKEAELLRAISSGDNAQPKIIPESEAPTDSARRDSIRTSPPLQAPVTAVQTTENLGQKFGASTDSGVESTPEIRTLQEMGNHPALEPKKTVPARMAAQPRISARTSNPNVRKPDTFRRVDREREVSESGVKLFANSRTVSLQEIEAERDRPFPFGYEAVATIAGRDATLRTGPRSADRALGSAPRFSEVSIDYRTGDWYRVQTTSGLRGWIQGQNLLFDAGISHNSAVRIGAVKAENTTRHAYRR